MRLSWLLIASLACACARPDPNHIDTATAVALLRANLEPEPVTVGVDWNALEKRGLMRENAKAAALDSRYVVTPQGTAAGVVQVVERGPGSISVSFEAKVCTREIADVTGIATIDSAAGAVEIRFTRRATSAVAPEPIFLSDSAPRVACDSTRRWTGRVVVLRDSAGWRMNRAPRWASPARTTTNYRYDDAGRLVGATSTIDAPAPTDADGDPLTILWQAGDDSTRTLTPDSAGLKLRLEHLIIYGRPQSASGRLIVRDRWGVADSLRVNVNFR